MNDVLLQLQSRNSAPRLTLPAPDAYSREQMVAAALRAPDHAWLTPSRFLFIEAERRERLGDVFESALLATNATADESLRNKARNAPLRAPLIVVVVCEVKAHPKVPREEQLMSSACAAYSMLLAAESQGYAGVWRTGAFSLDRHVCRALGLTDAEEIIGFLYFGTRDGQAKPLPERKVEDYVSNW